MRIQDPNGRYKPDPDYPNLLMVRVKADELGDYSILGLEGIDNDGDGQINEDGPGGYDSNRNWAFDWQPHYVQYGAHEFPFSLPNTHAVAQFVLSHPNIAAGQTYHNNGGMILRGPGREGGVSNGSDDRVLSEIARKGEMMLPYYRSLVCWSGLYSVWGGEFDWFYGARGIMMYCNELWTAKNMFRNDNTDRKAGTDFLKYLLLEQGIVEWEEYDHPTYGKIEIGGTSQYFRRIPPSFLLEEECHRNMAFTLYHADSMPMVSFGEISVEPIGKDLFKVWIEICNDRLMPTRSTHEAKNDISQPDIVSLKGRQAEAISAGRVTERYFKRVDPVKVRPYRIELSSVEGMNSERVQFIVSGKGFVLVTFDSAKGGLIEKRIELK